MNIVLREIIHNKCHEKPILCRRWNSPWRWTLEVFPSSLGDFLGPQLPEFLTTPSLPPKAMIELEAHDVLHVTYSISNHFYFCGITCLKSTWYSYGDGLSSYMASCHQITYKSCVSREPALLGLNHCMWQIFSSVVDIPLLRS